MTCADQRAAGVVRRQRKQRAFDRLRPSSDCLLWDIPRFALPPAEFTALPFTLPTFLRVERPFALVTAACLPFPPAIATCPHLPASLQHPPHRGYPTPTCITYGSLLDIICLPVPYLVPTCPFPLPGRSRTSMTGRAAFCSPGEPGSPCLLQCSGQPHPGQTWLSIVAVDSAMSLARPSSDSLNLPPI